MIDRGLPESKDDWPPGLLDAMRYWRQGDSVAAPPLFYMARLSVPVWSHTANQGDEHPDDRVLWLPGADAPPYGLVTTQTCDIGEVDADPIKPWVQIAPIFDGSDLNGSWRSLLKAGKGPRHLLHVPDLPGDEFWVADLRIEVPVEKGWLSGQQRIVGYSDEKKRERVGTRIAYLRGRPALSAPFVHQVQRPLTAALRQLKADDLDLFATIDHEVTEIRARLDSRLSTESAQLVVLSRQPVGSTTRDWLESWWDTASAAARRAGLDLQATDFMTLEEMSAADYIDSVLVPLERVSPA